MSAEKLFDAFYAVPNPHFNAFFEASTGSSEVHPLADLIAGEAVVSQGESGATVIEPAEEE
jgi:hypothetical protein